jgi:hypothetical protein
VTGPFRGAGRPEATGQAMPGRESRGIGARQPTSQTDTRCSMTVVWWLVKRHCRMRTAGRSGADHDGHDDAGRSPAARAHPRLRPPAGPSTGIGQAASAGTGPAMNTRGGFRLAAANQLRSDRRRADQATATSTGHGLRPGSRLAVADGSNSDRTQIEPVPGPGRAALDQAAAPPSLPACSPTEVPTWPRPRTPDSGAASPSPTGCSPPQTNPASAAGLGPNCRLTVAVCL